MNIVVMNDLFIYFIIIIFIYFFVCVFDFLL